MSQADPYDPASLAQAGGLERDIELVDQAKEAFKEAPSALQEEVRSVGERFPSGPTPGDLFVQAAQQGAIIRDATPFVGMGLVSPGGQPFTLADIYNATFDEQLVLGEGRTGFFERRYRLDPTKEVDFFDPQAALTVGYETKNPETGEVQGRGVSFLPRTQEVIDELDGQTVISKEKFDQIRKAVSAAGGPSFPEKAFDPAEMIDNDQTFEQALSLAEDQNQAFLTDMASRAARRRMLFPPPEGIDVDSWWTGAFKGGFDQMQRFSFGTQRLMAGAGSTMRTMGPTLGGFLSDIVAETQAVISDNIYVLGQLFDDYDAEYIRDQFDSIDDDTFAARTAQYFNNLASDINRELEIELGTAARDDFLFQVGNGFAQLGVQLATSALLAPVGLGWAGFVVSGMGVGGSMVYQERLKYYESQGMSDSDARAMATSDGFAAGVLIGLSESVVGGLGRALTRVEKLGPAIMREAARTGDLLARGATIGQRARAFGSGAVMGSMRESLQEGLDSIFRRAWLAVYREDPDAVNDFFSDEYLNLLFREMTVAAVVGGVAGPVGNMMTLTSMVDVKPGDEVRLFDLDENGKGVSEIVKVNAENLSEVRVKLLRSARLMDEVRQSQRSIFGAPGDAFHKIVARVTAPVDVEAFGRYLRSLTNEDGSRRYSDSEVSAKLQTLRGKYPGFVTLNDLFGDPKEAIRGTEGETGVIKTGARKIELAEVDAPLVNFLLETEAGAGGRMSKNSAVARARRMGLKDLAALLDSMSESNFKQLTEIAKASKERVQQRAEAALEAEFAEDPSDLDVETEAEPEATEDTNPVEYASDLLEQRLTAQLMIEGKTGEEAEGEAAELVDRLLVDELTEADNEMLANALRQEGDSDAEVQERVDALIAEIHADEYGVPLSADFEEELPPVVSPEEDVDEEIEDREEPAFTRGAASEAADVEEGTEETVSSPREVSETLSDYITKNFGEGARVVRPTDPGAQKAQRDLTVAGRTVVFIDTDGDPKFAGAVIGDDGTIFMHVRRIAQMTGGVKNTYTVIMNSVYAHEAVHVLAGSDPAEFRRFVATVIGRDFDGLLDALLVTMQAEPQLAEAFEKQSGLNLMSLLEEGGIVDAGQLADAFEKVLEFSQYRFELFNRQGTGQRLLEETLAYYMESMAVSDLMATQRVFAEFVANEEHTTFQTMWTRLERRLGMGRFSEESDWQDYDKWAFLRELAETTRRKDVPPQVKAREAAEAFAARQKERADFRDEYRDARQKAEADYLKAKARRERRQQLTSVALERLQNAVERIQVVGSLIKLSAAKSAQAIAFAGQQISESVIESPMGTFAQDLRPVPERMASIFGSGLRRAKKITGTAEQRRARMQSLMRKFRATFAPYGTETENLTRAEKYFQRRREVDQYEERTGTRGVTTLPVGTKALGLSEEVMDGDAPRTLDEIIADDTRFSRGLLPETETLGFQIGVGQPLRAPGLMGGLLSLSPTGNEIGTRGAVAGRNFLTRSVVLPDTRHNFATTLLRTSIDKVQDHYSLLKFSPDTFRKDLFEAHEDLSELAPLAIDDVMNDDLVKLVVPNADDRVSIRNAMDQRATRILDDFKQQILDMDVDDFNDQIADGSVNQSLELILETQTLLLANIGYTIRLDEIADKHAMMSNDPRAAAMFEVISRRTPAQLQRQISYVSPRQLHFGNTYAGYFHPYAMVGTDTGATDYLGDHVLSVPTNIQVAMTQHRQGASYHVALHEQVHQATVLELEEAVSSIAGLDNSLRDKLRNILRTQGNKVERKFVAALLYQDGGKAFEAINKKTLGRIKSRIEDYQKLMKSQAKLGDPTDNTEVLYKKIEDVVRDLAALELINNYVFYTALHIIDKAEKSHMLNFSLQDEVLREENEKRMQKFRKLWRGDKRPSTGRAALEFLFKLSQDEDLSKRFGNIGIYGFTNVNEFAAEVISSNEFTGDLGDLQQKYMPRENRKVPEVFKGVRSLLSKAKKLQQADPHYQPLASADLVLDQSLGNSDGIVASSVAATQTVAETLNPFTDTRFSRGLAKLWTRQPQEFGSGTTSIDSEKQKYPPVLFNLPEVNALSRFPAVRNRKKTLAGKVKFARGTINSDIGGGRFDYITNTIFRDTFGVKSYVYDPFNRDMGHNMQAAKAISNGKSDTATVSNVLNVIKEKFNRSLVIAQAADAIKPEGEAYFSMYNRPGEGGPTSGGESFQVGQDLEFYRAEIEKFFDEVEILKGFGVVIARKPKKQAVKKFANTINSDVKYSKGLTPTDFFFQGNEIDSARINPNLRRTKRFRAAMSESKVKDILYHGTRRKFADPLILNPAVGQMGVHLSDSPVVAQGFSGRVENYTDSRVYALYADIRNPVTLPDLLTWNLDSLMDSLETEIKENHPGKHKDILTRHGSYEGYFDFVAQQYSGLDYMALERSDYMDTEFMQFILRDLGFDGVRYLNRYEPGISLRNYALAVIRAEPNSSEMVAASNAELDASNALSELKTLMKRQFPKREGRLGASIAGRYIVSDTVIRKAMREFKRKFPDAIVNPDSYSYIAIDAKQLYSAVGDGRMTNDVNIAYSRGLADVKALLHADLAGAGKKAKKAIVRNLTYQRGIPASVLRKFVERDGLINQQIDKANKANDALQRALFKVHRSTEDRNLALVEANRLLQMPVDRISVERTKIDIPDVAREHIKEMRAHIDAMSNRIMREMDLSESMIGAISESLGFYLTRQYAAFSDPDWAKKVDPEVRARMKSALLAAYEEAFEMAEAEPRLINGKANPRHLPRGRREQAVEQLMTDILYRAENSESPMAFVAGLGDSVTGSIFRKRKLVERSREAEVAALDERQRALDDKFAGKKISKREYNKQSRKIQKERTEAGNFNYEANNELVQAYRAFLGESSDPMNNYATSITKMITQLEQHRF